MSHPTEWTLPRHVPQELQSFTRDGERAYQDGYDDDAHQLPIGSQRWHAWRVGYSYSHRKHLEAGLAKAEA